eukprot:TRINITY_DN12037_c0_g1_i1.p1 TRINITY_DN12037_c0_g1~~TRINITY_DN12037_c0_g1_i1.p1  ORF type:complete len:242 (-),score=44.73 TRINITY_DN12037_c0_g1_i1:102-827(-)
MSSPPSRLVSPSRRNQLKDPSSPKSEDGRRPILSARQRQRSSRPSSAATRASSAGSHNYYSYDAFIGGGNGSRPSSSARRWSAQKAVPRMFEEISTKDVKPNALNLKYGPREVEFREVGERLKVEIEEANKREGAQARDGKFRRAQAENVVRGNHHIATGQPWRAAAYGGRRSCPNHLPGGRFKGGPNNACAAGPGLFSDVPLLEAGESAARWCHVHGEVPDGRRSRANSANEQRSRRLSS